MITPRLRASVSALSLAAVLAAPLALGACAAGGAAPAAFDDGVAPARSLAIQFENDGDVQVDVYLVTEVQQWRLGRVASGARTTLKVPAEALRTPMPGNARLAVLADAPITAQAAFDPRASLTMAQTMSELVAQRWSFWHRQLGAARLLGAYERAGRR
ncbi:MAG TPA: hypothetical protein VFJ74_18170 [Gemmatimonadaceae bacterium]|nr:hypothetical protein [Gemmatimonadaceae bacterium]